MARRYRPLRGVRVLSFEAAFSLPAATRILSELGADVVRVARPSGDFPPYTHQTDGSGINKRSLAIDLRHEEGRALARRLVAEADVIANNFRPQVMGRYGLDDAGLRAVKPAIIVLQLSGYGVPGPWQSFPAFGPSVEAAGGMNAAIGGPGDPPVRVGSGVFADQTAGRYAALAVLMALEHRRVTGEGRSIDLSMYAGIVHLLGDLVLQAAGDGQAPLRMGNRAAAVAPQGVYPCRGDDEWLTLSVENDDQWRSLRALIGNPALDRSVFDSLEGRRAGHDRIDEAIAGWTRERSKEEAATLLQQLGVPAGPVQKASDLPFDPQLAFRGAFQQVRHAEPVLGYVAHPHLTLSWSVAGRQRPPLQDARPEGSGNRPVLKDWLGLSAREVAALERSGALISPRRAQVPPGIRPREAQVDPDFAGRLGLQPPEPASGLSGDQ